MGLLVPGAAMAEAVLERMGRHEMRARHQAVWHRLGRGMGAAGAQQLRQDVGVRAFRALAVGRRDRLVDLAAAEAGHEDAMRPGGYDRGHGGIAGLEQRAPGH